MLWEGVTLFFVFSLVGASAIKFFVSSRLFRYGLPKNILSIGQKTKGRRGGSREDTEIPDLVAPKIFDHFWTKICLTSAILNGFSLF